MRVRRLRARACRSLAGPFSGRNGAIHRRSVESRQVGNRHFWFVADSLDGRDLLVTTTLLKGSARKKRYPDQRYGYAGDRLDARLLHFEKSEGRLLITLPGQRERVVAASFDVAATAEGGGWIAIDELLNDERSFFGLDGFSMELGIGNLP